MQVPARRPSSASSSTGSIAHQCGWWCSTSTSTPPPDSGRLAARALTTVGGWEHQRLAERTRKGLAAARARGTTGRPAVGDRPELVEQITTMRAGGMTLQAIADTLNAQGQPTVRGGARWRPSSVQTSLGYKRLPRPADPNTKANGHDR
jgi:recombinase